MQKKEEGGRGRGGRERSGRKGQEGEKLNWEGGEGGR